MLECVDEAPVLGLEADGLVHEGGERIAGVVGRERAVAGDRKRFEHRLEDGDDARKDAAAASISRDTAVRTAVGWLVEFHPDPVPAFRRADRRLDRERNAVGDLARRG